MGHVFGLNLNKIDTETSPTCEPWPDIAGFLLRLPDFLALRVHRQLLFTLSYAGVDLWKHRKNGFSTTTCPLLSLLECFFDFRTESD